MCLNAQLIIILVVKSGSIYSELGVEMQYQGERYLICIVNNEDIQTLQLFIVSALKASNGNFSGIGNLIQDFGHFYSLELDIFRIAYRHILLQTTINKICSKNIASFSLFQIVVGNTQTYHKSRDHISQLNIKLYFIQIYQDFGNVYSLGLYIFRIAYRRRYYVLVKIKQIFGQSTRLKK